MPKFEQQKIFEYTVEQLYNLVVDVEAYPEFIPWCTAIKVQERSSTYMIVDMAITFKTFTEAYKSRVVLTPPRKEKSGLKYAEVGVDMISGPFRYLFNKWTLQEVENGTMVYFSIDFQFQSRILDRIIGALFAKACQKMTEAFENRAIALYKRGKNE
jgi:coenzyme Q-binding protein COQ10